MPVTDEIDAALVTAFRDADQAPRDIQFVIVLNNEARNEFMRSMAERWDFVQRRDGIMGAKYRGAFLAVCQDGEMPRVSIFSRPMVRA